MNAIKCAVCLESHVPRKMNVNVGCGHVVYNGCIKTTKLYNDMEEPTNKCLPRVVAR